MKKILLSSVVLFFAVHSFGQRSCNTMENHERLLQENPSFHSNLENIEEFTNKMIANGSVDMEKAVITIPVVFHILYNTSSQNVSDAQIQSQLDVLNKDFRKLNSDVSLTPSTFSTSVADCEINFCLASKSPTGTSTSGIIRKSTTVTSFSANDAMKFNSQGGSDAWPTGQYLNIWVCNLGGGLLGYAQFPGGSASTDGVVVNYTAFGTTGTASSPFNKGRTSTHEVGHWLNLRHIWGDANCGSDLVSDTPVHYTSNGGCPSHPKSNSCGTSAEMHMNYMDYSDDACMYMFTAGQKSRMQALFVSGGFRESLKTSTGCGGTATPTYCAANGTNTQYEWISNVKLGTINNTSSANGGYGNFTSISTDLTKGSAYTISMTPTYSGTVYTEYFKVYIDYNGDADFADAGELVYTSAGVTAATSASITIPSTAITGSTRMRVIMKDGSISGPCEVYTYGEVEDYTINLKEAVTTTTYCAANGTNAQYEWISNVKLGTINNTSSSNGGYGNFTSISTDLTKGSAYTISMTPTYSGTVYTEYFKVYIDYNGDADFADAGELVYTSSGVTATTSASITIPSTAITGSTRMRVIMKDGSISGPCEVYTYGEVEDYTVNLKEATATCNQPSSLASSSITSSSATMSWQAVSGASSYTLQYKTSSTSTWTSVTITGTSYNASSLASGTTYNWQVKTNCSSGSSAYTVGSNFTTSSGCSDIYESNNSLSAAKAISVNTNITALIGTSTDLDWFKFSNTSTAKNIKITLTNLPFDYDLRLYNGSGTLLYKSENGGTTSETITFNNANVATYYIRVNGYNGVYSTSSCYLLKAAISGTAFKLDTSEEEEVVINESLETSISMFPNPSVDGKFVCYLTNEETGSININVTDATGRLVRNITFDKADSFIKTEIDLSENQPGIYYVTLYNDNFKQTVKVIYAN